MTDKSSLFSQFEIISYSEDYQREILEYLNTMDDKQIKAYLIAKQHLGSSFNILKSNGFIHWKKTQQ